MSSVIARKEKTYRMPVFALIFIFIGAGLLIFSFKELNTYTHKNNSYTSTEARVIKHTYENGKVSSVILEYTVGDNKYTVYSNDRTDCVKSYGSIINVKYDPNNPEDVIFANRSINIVIPVAALVLLSIGLAIIIVMLSDNIRRIKKYSKMIADKSKKSINNSNSYNNFDYINQTNNMTNYNTNNNINNNIVNSTADNNIINEEQVKEIRELKTEHKKITEEEPKDKIIKIPSIPVDSPNPFEDVNYLDFISGIEEKDETPDFIPNMDDLKKNKK